MVISCFCFFEFTLFLAGGKGKALLSSPQEAQEPLAAISGKLDNVEDDFQGDSQGAMWCQGLN